MYRMLQSLEREPLPPSSTSNSTAHTTAHHEDSHENDDSNNSLNHESKEGKDGRDGKEREKGKRTNPHKYLLYRPTFSQLYLYLASAFKVSITVHATRFFVLNLAKRFNH